MIRELMHDPIFLGAKSEPAVKEDFPMLKICLKRL